MRATKPEPSPRSPGAPIGIQRDQNRGGEREILFASRESPVGTPRAMRRPVTDPLSPEHPYLPYTCREGFAVLCVCEGNATAVVDRVSLPLGKGDLLIVNPFEVCGILLPSPTSPFSLLTVTWHPHRIFPQEREENGFFSTLRDVTFQNHIPADHPANQPLRACIQRMEALQKSADFGDTVSIFAELTHFYALAITLLPSRKKAIEGNVNLAFMSRVGDYLEEHLDEDISTAELAKHFQYSAEHFCRLFKKCFGQTFKDYLNIYRIRKAREFIDAGDFDTLAEISTKCGFNNQNHFSRMFKKYIGILPSEYSRKKKQET